MKTGVSIVLSLLLAVAPAMLALDFNLVPGNAPVACASGVSSDCDSDVSCGCGGHCACMEDGGQPSRNSEPLQATANTAHQDGMAVARPVESTEFVSKPFDSKGDFHPPHSIAAVPAPLFKMDCRYQL